MDYKEEPVGEPEGKSYHPSLIMLNPEFYKYKIWPTIKPDFYKMHGVIFWWIKQVFSPDLLITNFDIKAFPWALNTLIPW